MVVREVVRELFVDVYEHNISVDEAMNKHDESVEKMIGPDSTMSEPMPERWGPALKKQWVNFRNHAKREIRRRYRG